MNTAMMEGEVDRRFNEVELREMLERAEGCRPDIVEGRCAIDTRHRMVRHVVEAGREANVAGPLDHAVVRWWIGSKSRCERIKS